MTVACAPPLQPLTAARWVAQATRGLTIARACLWAALLPAAALAAAAKPAPAAPSVQGTVTRIDSGDSLVLSPPGGAEVTVRLRDIDAPDSCQPGGDEARRALAELALNKPASLRATGRDKLGRTVGTLTVDGVNVGTRMVEEGHAWSIRTRYDQGPLVKQERMAHALGRGLHGAAGAVMPKDFRRNHGPCAAGEAVAAPVRTPVPPPALAAPVAAMPLKATVPPGYRCDGRTRCTQMTSCDEARFFLAQCPNVQMDGDRNGVPCERQWCH